MDDAIEERGAMGVHHTETSDAAWDGPGNKARLRNDGNAAYYRRAFAWRDPDADAGTKAAWKFPHHEVGDDGEIGAANLRACSAGIAVLNGGRGGANIPDADRAGVHRHLAAHLRDAEKEVPPLRSLSPALAVRGQREYRFLPLTELEVRVADDDGGPVIAGYAARFNSPSEGLPGFRETIEPGAFARTLKQSDVVSTYNHNADMPLGRISNGRLTLREDERGLWMEVRPTDTSYARDLMTNIREGNVKGQSFIFRATKGGERWSTDEDGTPLRSLTEVQLFEVGPVLFPAYPATNVDLRSADSVLETAPWPILRDAVRAYARQAVAALEASDERAMHMHMAECKLLMGAMGATMEQMMGMMGEMMQAMYPEKMELEDGAGEMANEEPGEYEGRAAKMPKALLETMGTTKAMMASTAEMIGKTMGEDDAEHKEDHERQLPPDPALDGHSGDDEAGGEQTQERDSLDLYRRKLTLLTLS